jgi:integrase
MSDLITAHCEWARAAGLSARTVGERAGWLWRAEKALAPYGVESPNEREVVTFLGPERWKPATRAKVYDHLKAFYVWATEGDDPILDKNPMWRLKRPHVERGEPRPLTDEEFTFVLSEAREPYRTSAILAGFNGLRVTELSMLWRQEVTEQQIFIRCAKGGKTASVWTNPTVWEAVCDMPRGPVIERLGGVSDGRLMSMRASVYFARTLGMPGVGLHRFRHTYARMLREAGADALTLKRCLRHKSVATTEVYVEASEAECRTAIQQLRPNTEIRTPW